jgi:hypothetical protein
MTAPPLTTSAVFKANRRIDSANKLEESAVKKEDEAARLRERADQERESADRILNGQEASDLLEDEPADLLLSITAFVRRFVVLAPAQADVIALWVLHTWTIDAAEATPFLAVLSPEMRSGKTRLLEVLELIVRNPWRAVNPSEAVLYRKVSTQQPTLLLDETDNIFK